MNNRQLDSLARTGNGLSGGLLTIADVSLFFNVPKSWIYERTRKRGPDTLPYIKLGKYIRFEEPAIRKFLENQRKSVRII